MCWLSMMAGASCVPRAVQAAPSQPQPLQQPERDGSPAGSHPQTSLFCASDFLSISQRSLWTCGLAQYWSGNRLMGTAITCAYSLWKPRGIVRNLKEINLKPVNYIHIWRLVNVHMIAANTTLCVRIKCATETGCRSYTSSKSLCGFAGKKKPSASALGMWGQRQASDHLQEVWVTFQDLGQNQEKTLRLWNAGLSGSGAPRVILMPWSANQTFGFRLKMWFSSMNECSAENLSLWANKPHRDCSRIDAPRFYCSFRKGLKNTVRQSNTPETYTREQQSH